MKMKLLPLFACLSLSVVLQAQSPRPKVSISPVQIEWGGKMVNARRLTVHSEIPMSVEQVWSNVKTPALLQFVAQGKIRFTPVSDPFPDTWQEGDTVATKMRVWGFLPFGGIHYLYINQVDETQYKITTQEWDRRAKVWNHEILLRDLGGGKTYYEGSIIIYGGWLTGFITRFAKRFYIHRQKRWQIVATEKMDFTS